VALVIAAGASISLAWHQSEDSVARSHALRIGLLAAQIAVAADVADDDYPGPTGDPAWWPGQAVETGIT
jgi:hypothetical protein